MGAAQEEPRVGAVGGLSAIEDYGLLIGLTGLKENLIGLSRLLKTGTIEEARLSGPTPA